LFSCFWIIFHENIIRHFHVNIGLKWQVMVHSWREGKVADVIFGIVVPTLVALLIVGVSMLSTPSLVGLKYPLLEAIVIVGVPMLIGLIWNQWAGGASGFLLGSLYALFYADQLYAAQGSTDISLLGNLISAMLIGYIAGALGKRSINLRRLMFAGLTAGVMGSVIIVVVSQFSPIIGTSASGTLLIFLPRILAGFIVPFIARAFLRHGASQSKEHKFNNDF
jgi:hypothetical protein